VRLADHLYRGVLWMSVCCVRCLLSARFLCDRLITCTEEVYGYVYSMIVVCCEVEVCATG